MLDFFKKRRVKLCEHQYKNLLIPLPSHWEYQLEEGDIQACYDPKSQSTLRIHIIKAIHRGTYMERDIEALTNDQPYVTTSRGYLLVNPTYVNSHENGQNITLVTWRLVNHTPIQKLIAVLTYTVISTEIESKKEKQTISLIENCLQKAELK